MGTLLTSASKRMTFRPKIYYQIDFSLVFLIAVVGTKVNIVVNFQLIMGDFYSNPPTKVPQVNAAVLH